MEFISHLFELQVILCDFAVVSIQDAPYVACHLDRGLFSHDGKKRQCVENDSQLQPQSHTGHFLPNTLASTRSMAPT